jgi:hypothetical protein
VQRTGTSLKKCHVCSPMYDKSTEIPSCVFTDNTDHTKKHDQCPRIKVNNCNTFAFRRHQCHTITHFAVDNKDASKDGRIRRRVDIKYTFQALENTAVSFLLYHLHPTHASGLLQPCTALSSRRDACCWQFSRFWISSLVCVGTVKVHPAIVT